MNQTRTHIRTLAVAAMLIASAWPGAIDAQTNGTARRAPAYLRGVAVSKGLPLAGVNIFDIETLEGTVTREDGRFVIVIGDSTRTTVHLIAKAVGFTPVDTTIVFREAASPDSLALNLTALGTLVPINVLAGRYTANASRTSTLSPTEVASTPGSNADISGAIKTLPGVQNVDEGSGIFVRGGDFTETRMFVDGAPLFSAYQFEAPTGSVAGTINPFLTSSITFASGGFGADWGNALSGIVDLRTQGRVAQSYVNVNASILGATLGGGLALPHGLGVTATAGATDLRAMLVMNGNPRAFSPAPHGQTLSALAVWEYRRTGTVKMFALWQRNAFAVPVVDPASVSNFASDGHSDMVVASWTDSIAKVRPFVSVSTSGFSRDEQKGAYQQNTLQRSVQARANAEITFHERLKSLAGMEVERLSADFTGTFPQNQYNSTPNAPTVRALLNAAATRTAWHLSLDARPSAATELIVGIRTTQSGYATARTIDPRVSFAWVPRALVTLTASVGQYHQVADPAFLDRLVDTDPRLPELSARMVIAGMQIGETLRQLRVEVWAKDYDALVGLTRTYATVAELDGRARGADVFVRTTAPLGTNVRLTYSLSNSERTDPNSLQLVRANFDVTSSTTFILQREWQSGWSAGIAVKQATGRPFTDILGAAFDAVHDVYIPTYEAANARRLPSFSRTDLTVSKTLPWGGSRFGVVYAGVNNVLNQTNTFAYTWSRDYSVRIPVRSTVSRTFFVGGNLVLLAAR